MYIFDLFLLLAIFDFSYLLLLGEVTFLLEHTHGNPNLVRITPHVESPIYCTHYQGLIHFY
jgi:hypothetical protein